MDKVGFFTANDDGQVVAKTEINPDGSVDRYPYTKPDDIKSGHGHQTWGDLDDYLLDKKPDWERDKDAQKSQNRRWRGQGYDLSLEELNNLSIGELQELLELTSDNYIHTTEEIFIRNTHKQFVLK